MTVGCNYGHQVTGCKAVEYGLIWAELIDFCLVGPLPLARPPHVALVWSARTRRVG